MYKPFKEGYLHPSIYDKVFSNDSVSIDPVTQAFVNYRKEVVMDTAEEEKLENLQVEREKLIGVVKDGLDALPQNGYSLSSKFREIEEKEYDYKHFRDSLGKKRKGLQELDYLDEMINDFNYMMFH